MKIKIKEGVIFTFGDLKNLSLQKNRPLVLELGLSECASKFDPQYTLQPLGRNKDFGFAWVIGMSVVL